MARQRFVVIGEGAAGVAAAQELRRQDPHAAIGLFTDEPQPAYFRAALTNFLLGELREDQLWVNAPDFFETFGIRRAFARVVSIDPARSILWDSSSAEPTPFDRLLVASGARPRRPLFEGALLPGVVTLRTLHDARALMDRLHVARPERAVVLGGGPLGLEWAHALLERGVAVTLVERSARLMSRVLDEVTSDLLSTRLGQAGIEVCLGDSVEQAYPDARGHVSGVRLTSGRQLPGSLVAAALGVLPNTEFLSGSGLALGAQGAVRVDRSLASSAPNIWAAGDVAEVDGEQLALWEPARLQGRVAARNMAGGKQRYEPGAHYFATRLFDLDFATVGDIQRAPGREEVIDFPRGTGTIAYRKLVLEQGRLVGALMIGERAMRVRAFGRTLKRLVDARADISAIKHQIWNHHFDLNAWFETRKLLEKPRPATTNAPLAARVRGTQAINLPSGGTFALPSEPHVAAAEAERAPPGTQLLQARDDAARVGSSARQGTRRLSIGLPAELALATRAALASAAPSAVLERDGQSIPLERKVTTLGTEAGADVVLRAPRAGARHAQIVEQHAAFYLRDLGSHIGTYVNGDPLTQVQRLADGDRIQIGGETLLFRAISQQLRPEPRGAGVAAPRLIVRAGAQFGLKLRLGQRAMNIGRGQNADIRLDDAGIAELHARVRYDGSRSFIEALDASASSVLGGQSLVVGQPLALSEGQLLRLGSVELLYTEAPLEDAARALVSAARLTVDAGPTPGQCITFRGTARVGSGPNVALSLPGLAAAAFEIVEHGTSFWIRDLSGGRTLRAGRPLGPDFVPLQHGDLLLLDHGMLVRFEEV